MKRLLQKTCHRGPPPVATPRTFHQPPPLLLDRRSLLGLLASSSSLLTIAPFPNAAQAVAEESKPGLFAFALATGGEAEAFGEELAARGTTRALDPKVASLLTGAIPAAIQSLDLDRDYNLTFSKLSAREWPFYKEAYKDKLPAIPDLSDLSGGLSNTAFFNFVSYISWKAMVKTIPDDADRGRVAVEAGRSVAESLLGPDRLQSLRSQASRSPTKRANWADVRSALDDLLQLLKRSSYILGYEVVYGSTPSISNPQAGPGGKPAVITAIDQGSNESEKLDLGPGDVLQIRFLLPADLDGSISFQQEQGFYPAIVPVALRTILRESGFEDANWSDLYFFMDSYRAPKSLKDKLLLAFGDPLFQVEIPWEPTSLVADFVL